MACVCARARVFALAIWLMCGICDFIDFATTATAAATTHNYGDSYSMLNMASRIANTAKCQLAYNFSCCTY